MGIDVKNQPKIQINTRTVDADVDNALKSVDSAVAILKMAVDFARRGDNHKPMFEVSNDVAGNVYAALDAFLKGRPLLDANETAAMKSFAGALSNKVTVADSAAKSVLEAERAHLKEKGAVEYNGSDLGAWNDHMLAEKLSEKANETGKPAFAEYFGAFMVAKPNTFVDKKLAADLVRSEFQEKTKPNVASTLRNASQQAARRAEISEGQAKPVRSIEDIEKASQDRAEKSGGSRDSLAGRIGYALQDIVHHGEIDAFAKHLLGMALKNDDVMTIADPGARLDRARDRAAHWINHFGRNEKVIDDVWYASLSKHVDAAKLAATPAVPSGGRSIEDITKASQDRAEKQGYKRDSLAGQIGYALQDLTDKNEINAFAQHLLSMALKSDDIAKISNGAERLDRAKDRAGSWVNHFGKNDRAIDAMWYGALHAQVEEMKGVPKEVTQAKVDAETQARQKRIEARTNEIAEAQTKPMRSVEDITLASQQRAEKSGYKKDSMAGLVGYALQDLVHHGEIDAFAKHMLGMALKTDDIAKITDKAEQIDRARDRAGSWVNHYGQNEAAIDKVWYGALAKHADAMKE